MHVSVCECVCESVCECVRVCAGSGGPDVVEAAGRPQGYQPSWERTGWRGEALLSWVVSGSSSRAPVDRGLVAQATDIPVVSGQRNPSGKCS